MLNMDSWQIHFKSPLLIQVKMLLDVDTDATTNWWVKHLQKGLKKSKVFKVPGVFRGGILRC